MNSSGQHFGEGNIFRINNTSSNVPTFGSPSTNANVIPVFGDTSQKLSNAGGFITASSFENASQNMPNNAGFGVNPLFSNTPQRIATNSTGFGLFTQQNNIQQNTNLNTAQKGFTFGGQPTFGKEDTKGSAFGSVLTASNIFGQKESPSGGGLFSTPSDSFKLLGQTPGKVLDKSNASPPTVFASNQSNALPQTVFASNQSNAPPQAVFASNQSTSVFGSKTKNVFGALGNNATKSISRTSGGSINASPSTFGGFSNPANPASSSHNVFANPGSGQTGVFGEASALGSLKKSTNSVFGRIQRGGNEMIGSEKRELSKVIQKNQVLKSRLTEGMTRLEVQNIPQHMNDEASLRRHFSKFGPITRLIKKSDHSVIVAFNNSSSARKAKENGSLIDANCEPMIINFRIANNQRAIESVLAIRNQERLEGRTHDNSRSSFQTSRVNKRGMECVEDDGSRQTNAFKQRQSERADSPQTAPKFSEEPVQTLMNLSSSCPSNAEERYRTLENRDKTIRNASQKSSDLATSEVVRGTCTDMCPEKERYMRECQRRLSIFEVVPGSDQPGHTPSVDHFRAVKEYSRSSADQEMPLPSELRPPHILNMTMDYLLTSVINKGSVGFWADWYDFLWNRMRAIRKDITQQMLCDTTAAELVEKSARFHILCSELLCEEEAGIFDQKINSENLTKCLQTLKEMYHDLYVRHGIVCQNEAEFRSYMLLMNINNAGDILREAEQWRPKVRQSHSFRHSMQAYLSITNNNYIKFFKLVKKASYLDSCILHRYFNQVRSLAVTRIAKAFNSPASGYCISYPFHDLVNHLGFESSEEASAFLGHFGLVVTNGQITSENKQGRVAELEGASLPVNRSHRLVGSKAKTSLGEIVNGGHLPIVPPRPPRNSFNEQGYLVTDEVDAPVYVNQSASSEPDLLRHQQIPSEQRNYAPSPVKQSLSSTDILRRQIIFDVEEAVRHVRDDIVQEVTVTMVKDVSESAIEESHRYLLLANLSGEALIRETVEECVRECSIEVINQLKKEREELINHLTNQMAVDIYEEVINSEIRNVCTDTMNAAWLADTEMRKDNAVVSLAEDLLNEVAISESNAFCQQYFQSQVKDVLDGLEDLKTNGERILMKSYWKCWMAATQQKRIDQTLASTVNLRQNTTEIFESMFPRSGHFDVQDALSHDFLPLDGDFGISLLRPDEVLSRQEEIRLCLEREEANLIERRRLCWSPMNVLKMVEESVAMDEDLYLGSKMFWKLIISLPCDGFVFTYKKQMFKKWLARKFKMSEDDDIHENGDDFCFVRTKSVIVPTNRDASSRYGSLNVCIRSVTDGSTSAADLLGASSVIFFVRDHSDDRCDVQLLEAESHRLRSLLKSKPVLPSLPLVIMCSTKGRNLTRARITEMFGLKDLIDEELISYYDIIMNDDLSVNDLDTTHLLTEGTDWLLQRSPQPPPLITRSVVEFFEENVNRFFTGPVLKNLKKRRENSLQDLSFASLVDFYNAVVKWLAIVVTGDKFEHASWPPAEFCERFPDLPPTTWNEASTLSELERFLHRSIRLPKYPSVRDLEDIDDDGSLFEYVKVVVMGSNSPWKLTTKINNLLEMLELEAASRMNKRKSMESSHLPPPPPIFPRTSVVLACIDFKLSEICDFDESRDARPLSVTYFASGLSEEDAPSLDASSLEEARSPIRRTKNDEIFERGLENGSANNNNNNNSLHFNKKSRDLFDSEFEAAFNKGISSLFDRLQSEKEASENFEKYLEKVLDDGNSTAVENGVKHKRAKLMTEEEKKSTRTENRVTNSLATPTKSALLYASVSAGALSKSCKVEDDVKYLNFKIQQEKQASALLDLRAKLFLG